MGLNSPPCPNSPKYSTQVGQPLISRCASFTRIKSFLWHVQLSFFRSIPNMHCCKAGSRPEKCSLPLASTLYVWMNWANCCATDCFESIAIQQFKQVHFCVIRCTWHLDLVTTVLSNFELINIINVKFSTSFTVQVTTSTLGSYEL